MKKEEKYNVIIFVVAEHYKESISKILSKSRKRKYTFLRQIIMNLCLHFIERDKKRVGQEIGFFTVSTVKYAKKTIEGYKETDKQFDYQYNFLVEKLQNIFNSV